MRTRDFDALIAHLGELGVLDREDLVIMHRLPPQERLPYVRARAQAAVDLWQVSEDAERAGGEQPASSFFFNLTLTKTQHTT
jgi:hypothetical protein